MSDLIEALNILLKYGDLEWPTWCEHDIIRFCYDPCVVSTEDRTRLEELGIEADEDEECFYSFRYGSE